jgi:hypothetical protein
MLGITVVFQGLCRKAVFINVRITPALKLKYMQMQYLFALVIRLLNFSSVSLYLVDRLLII